MESNENMCVYCREVMSKHSLGWVVRVATKPKKTPHRLKHVGYCCSSCHAEGKPIKIDNY